MVGTPDLRPQSSAASEAGYTCASLFLAPSGPKSSCDWFGPTHGLPPSQAGQLQLHDGTPATAWPGSHLYPTSTLQWPETGGSRAPCPRAISASSPDTDSQMQVTKSKLDRQEEVSTGDLEKWLSERKERKLSHDLSVWG